MPADPHPNKTDEELEAEAREATINSPEFKEWWKYRRGIHPLPRDPYRAYMIDRGIQAPLTVKETWEDWVNWTDSPPIDNVRQGHIPKGRHRKHPPPNYRPQSTSYTPPHQQDVTAKYKNDKLYKELYGFKREMEQFYGIPESELRIEPTGGSAYYMKPQWIGKPLIVVPEKQYKFVKASRKKGHRSQLLATVGHEGGHATQWNSGYDLPPTGRLRTLFEKVEKEQGIEYNNPNNFSSERKKVEEPYAWAAEHDFIENRPQKHLKGTKGTVKVLESFALSSYGVNRPPPALMGDKPKAVYDLNTNLILKPSESKLPHKITSINSTRAFRKQPSINTTVPKISGLVGLTKAKPIKRNKRK